MYGVGIVFGTGIHRIIHGFEETVVLGEFPLHTTVAEIPDDHVAHGGEEIMFQGCDGKVISPFPQGFKDIVHDFLTVLAYADLPVGVGEELFYVPAVDRLECAGVFSFEQVNKFVIGMVFILRQGA